MSSEHSGEKDSLVAEITQKIRLLNIIAAFVIITLLAVIFRYLFKPLGEVLDFLPDISITLIIGIVVFLALLAFYMWALVSRRIIRNIGDYKNRLDRILTVTKDVREEIYGDILLERIIDASIALTRSDAGSVLLLENGDLVFKITKGAKAELLPGTKIPAGRGIAGWVAESGKAVRSGDLRGDGRFDPEVDMRTGYETKSILCIPLTMKSGVIGVIELLNKTEGYYTEKDEELIGYLADQAAISLARAKFIEDQKNYEIHLTDILLETLDSQIMEKTGHSKRVARYSTLIAKAINMPEEEQRNLYFACLLHDVGFLKIRNEDNFRREYYVKHPVIGYEMIRPINFYEGIAPFILHHHERYDGTGYPMNLAGEAIPLESRIIAIADAFDAMVSENSYKVPLSFDAAIEELQRNAGTQFDFWLVEVFVQNISPDQL